MERHLRQRMVHAGFGGAWAKLAQPQVVGDAEIEVALDDPPRGSGLGSSTCSPSEGVAKRAVTEGGLVDKELANTLFEIECLATRTRQSTVRSPLNGGSRHLGPLVVPIGPALLSLELAPKRLDRSLLEGEREDFRGPMALPKRLTPLRQRAPPTSASDAEATGATRLRCAAALEHRQPALGRPGVRALGGLRKARDRRLRRWRRGPGASLRDGRHLVRRALPNAWRAAADLTRAI